MATSTQGKRYLYKGELCVILSKSVEPTGTSIRTARRTSSECYGIQYEPTGVKTLVPVTYFHRYSQEVKE